MAKDMSPDNALNIRRRKQQCPFCMRWFKYEKCHRRFCDNNPALLMSTHEEEEIFVGERNLYSPTYFCPTPASITTTTSVALTTDVPPATIPQRVFLQRVPFPVLYEEVLKERHAREAEEAMFYNGQDLNITPGGPTHRIHPFPPYPPPIVTIAATSSTTVTTLCDSTTGIDPRSPTSHDVTQEHVTRSDTWPGYGQLLHQDYHYGTLPESAYPRLMPLTRASTRASSNALATKIPKPTGNRKRGITSPSGKHKQCPKRVALSDITNKTLTDSIGNDLSKKTAASRTAVTVPFTIHEEPTVIEPKSKKSKKQDTKSVPKEKDIKTEPTQKWRDIDKDVTDPMFSPEYAEEIFHNLQKRELDFMVGDYIKNQTEITIQMRSILIDWLVEVQETFALVHETLYLAVRMVDRYLDKCDVRKAHLQLLGVTAIFLASKMEERYPPPLEDFIFVCDRAYTEEEILKMERLLCAELEYEVYMPLSYSFLRRYGKCVNADMRQLTIGRYVLELTLQEYEYVTYRPSLLAAAALYFSMQKTIPSEDQPAIWDETLQHYTAFTADDLDELVRMLDQSTIRASTDDRCQTIYKKYSHEVFYEVAQLPPLHPQ